MYPAAIKTLDDLELENPFAKQISVEDYDFQFAGYGAKQFGYNYINQLAGGYSTQVGGFRVRQSALYLANQYSLDFSIQIAGNNSVQQSGQYSVLIAGQGSKQKAGYGSTLVCRFKNPLSGFSIAETLFVDEEKSNRWFTFNINLGKWFEIKIDL